MKPIKLKIFYIAAVFFTLLSLSGCSDSGTVQEENIASYDITIPGLTGEYNFLFLTDTHIIVSDENEEQQIREYASQRQPIFDSEEPVDIPQLDSWMEYIDEQDYDGLLLGGDIIDFPSSANLEYLASSLQKLKTPYLYTPGNHDWTYPWEYMTEKGKVDYLPLFNPYMEGNTAIHTLEYDEFTLVAVDDSSNQISPDALETYKEILSQGKPVIVLLHVPLYTESLLSKAKEVWDNSVTLGGGIHGGIYPDQTSTEFINLTLAADSPVAAVLAGHVHFGESSVLLGDKNIPQITGDAGYKGKGTRIHLTGSK